MRAFRVFYSTPSMISGTKIVLVKDESYLEEALAQKERRYRIGRYGCSIYEKQELPLSNVMVSDLSIVELMMILKHQD